MLNQITAEELIQNFAPGGNTDGIRIFLPNGRPLGYITDLRVQLNRKQSARAKQKEYSNKVTEERREKMPEAVDEMVEFLTNHLPGAKVFKNITQPNVWLNGALCYITVDPIYNQHRLGIGHPVLNSSDMADMVQGFRVSEGNSEHHILWNGLSRDDIVETIKKVCQ